MQIGIPRESRAGETLVAATAKTADQLQQLGYDVVVQLGAGVAAAQPDSAFDEVGVRVGSADDVWGSDIIVKVNAPTSRPQQSEQRPQGFKPNGAPVYFENCDAARAAGAAPVRRGEPGYGPHLDGDGDGSACE